jgi:hypothetical protein
MHLTVSSLIETHALKGKGVIQFATQRSIIYRPDQWEDVL